MIRGSGRCITVRDARNAGTPYSFHELRCTVAAHSLLFLDEYDVPTMRPYVDLYGAFGFLEIPSAMGLVGLTLLSPASAWPLSATCCAGSSCTMARKR